MERIWELFYLFLCYSFLGWIIELVYTAIRKHQFINRGFLNGPLCTVYGFAAVFMTVVLRELAGRWFFLILGCAVLGTAVEWAAGLLLERIGTGKWWDYSRRRFNIGGYVCLEATVCWGLLGGAALTWGNALLLMLWNIVPELIRHIILLILLVLVLLDAAGSLAAISRLNKLLRLMVFNDKIDEVTQLMGKTLVDALARRIERAHPASIRRREKRKATVFAQGCGFYKLFWLLVIGAFVGDMVEMIFVRVTSGVWMSRSSLVWGQFSLVWGFAMALATALLYRYRSRSDGFFFVIGTILGGAYEYVCSVFTEAAFGTVFWDYSKIPFNLGGRINLLYCFFWGIAAVIWVKRVYPVLSGLIEKVPMKIGIVVTWIMVVFLCVDIAVTCAAMGRYQQRVQGIEAQGPVTQWIDDTFPDEWMRERYQNMKLVD